MRMEALTYAFPDLGRTQHSVNHVEDPCLVLLCPWAPRPGILGHILIACFARVRRYLEGYLSCLGFDTLPSLPLCPRPRLELFWTVIREL